jgi:hypothetical protein
MDEKEIQKIVDRFLTSHEAGSIVSNDEGLEQVQENARHYALSASLEHDSYAWWSALPENVQQKWLANPKTPTIREAWEESQRRLKAVNFSRASMYLSGFEANLEDEALSVRYVNGELTISEIIHTIDEQLQHCNARKEGT